MIDWEFCYAAPVEFSHCSPWWLLLARPEAWDGGIDDFLAHYLPRRDIFLDVLREREDELARNNTPSHSTRLSEHMAQSVENGSFWFFIAATSRFAFDDIYWRFIHPKYHGQVEAIDDLRKLLSTDEQNNLEKLVRKKMDQMREDDLVSHRTLEEMTDA